MEPRTPLPWTVYCCPFADEEPGSACGINGSFDCSHDECHHPLNLQDARYIVQACNAFPKLVEALEKLYEKHLGTLEELQGEVRR